MSRFHPWNPLKAWAAIYDPHSGFATAVERSVVAALALFKNHETGECFPSVESLASDAGVTEKTVRSTLHRLRRREDAAIWIDWVQPSRNGHRWYTVELQRPRPSRKRDRERGPVTTTGRGPVTTTAPEGTPGGNSGRPSPVTAFAPAGNSGRRRPVTVTGDPSRDPRREPFIDPSGASAPKNKASSSSKKRTQAKPVPDNWRPPSELVDWARDDRAVLLDEETVEAQVQRFIDYQQAHGKKYADVGKAFKGWLRRFRDMNPDHEEPGPRPRREPPPTPEEREARLAERRAANARRPRVQTPPQRTREEIHAELARRQAFAAELELDPAIDHRAELMKHAPEPAAAKLARLEAMAAEAEEIGEPEPSAAGPDDFEREVIARVQGGEPVRDIAKALGCPVHRIQRVKTLHGLTKKRKPRGVLDGIITHAESAADGWEEALDMERLFERASAEEKAALHQALKAGEAAHQKLLAKVKTLAPEPADAGGPP